MTEQQWLTCDDLYRMTKGGPCTLKGRKARLFLVACCRAIWHIMTDARCRRAVEVAERFADGDATTEELSEARNAVRCREWNSTGGLARRVAAEKLYYYDWICRDAQDVALRHARQDPADKEARAAVARPQAGLFREIAGNPFRPVTLEPHWLAWNGETIPLLGLSIYEERAFGQMPILADALEDAGCTDPHILDHCRGPGPHVRGCWLLDLILGNE